MCHTSRLIGSPDGELRQPSRPKLQKIATGHNAGMKSTLLSQRTIMSDDDLYRFNETRRHHPHGASTTQHRFQSFPAPFLTLFSVSIPLLGQSVRVLRKGERKIDPLQVVVLRDRHWPSDQDFALAYDGQCLGYLQQCPVRVIKGGERDLQTDQSPARSAVSGVGDDLVAMFAH